jgi:hypothetical protein
MSTERVPATGTASEVRPNQLKAVSYALTVFAVLSGLVFAVQWIVSFARSW